MFIAGIRHLDRVRGSGWLDCPNCHEHALQDVIDDMRFLEVLRYRITPAGRRRDLLCRRCGYRRLASQQELSALQTGGKPIRSAWMVPLGGLGIAVVAGLALLVAHVGASTGAEVIQNLTFTEHTGMNVAPVKFLSPNQWNYDASTDSDPPTLRVADINGNEYFALRRLSDPNPTLNDIAVNHFADEQGINSLGFPTQPPCAKATAVAGQKAELLSIRYTSHGVDSEQRFYAFIHDGVGYTLTFVASGTDSITKLKDVESEVLKGFKFTAAETPVSPSPGASATPSPAASPSAAASPGASASPTPSVTPCPG